ncbi:MAG TPA: hypothetical protein VF399_09610 [bacterium]
MPLDDSQDAIPRLVFRCSKCWMSLGYIGPDELMICPRCDTELYVGYMEPRIVEGGARKTSEYDQLRCALRDSLKNMKDFTEIDCEEIAGPNTRHLPDAVYKNTTSENLKLLLYEIETCDTMLDDATVSKSRLFAMTALNLGAKFHIVVPRNCNGHNGKDLVNEVLSKNDIKGIDIICL